MESYTIRLVENQEETCCPRCGARHPGRSGLKLFAVDHDQPVCRTCGKKEAPEMIALLDLAHAAERVGKSFRHLLTPPMESLLDLAHAAENYLHTAPKCHAG
jgi:ribosomal protein L40E